MRDFLALDCAIGVDCGRVGVDIRFYYLIPFQAVAAIWKGISFAFIDIGEAVGLIILAWQGSKGHILLALRTVRESQSTAI